MRYILLVFVCFSFFVPLAAAQEEPELQPQSLYEKFTTAVAIGARADAYGAYCEKETQLSKAMIDKAKAENIEDPEGESLQVVQETVYAETMKELKERALTCKDVGFLLEKLDLMKMLKRTILAINGVESDEVIEKPAYNPL